MGLDDKHGASKDGRIARRAAASILAQVLDDHVPLDAAFINEVKTSLDHASPSDRAFARALVTTALRRRGQIDDALNHFVTKPLPEKSGSARHLLYIAVAELLFLDAKPHAAVDCAVSLAAEDVAARHFKGLVNAVLRRIAETKHDILATQDAARLNASDWLWQRWSKTFGEETTRAIAAAHLEEPPLDVTLKDPGSAGIWAERLDAVLLPTGSLRRRARGRIEDLPGFSEGAWWVQDAAAALPARLLGDVAGRTVVDLCAAPGGKTAQLAAAAANVIAVDRSSARLALVRDTLRRLTLRAELVTADAGAWMPATAVDFVLVDAPCSATGTLRRHPDAAHFKTANDIAALSRKQARLFDHASEMVASGGVIVFSTCSLEPEEGPRLIDDFLVRHPAFARVPVTADDVFLCDEFVTAAGDLRTLPNHWRQWGGLDGFYAARLKRF